MGSNRVTVGSQLPAGTNNIGDVDVLSLPALPAGTNNIGDVDVLTLPGVAGDVAHDTVDTGNPVKIGGKAVDFESMPAEVAAGDRVDAIYSPKGIAAVGLFNFATGALIENLPVTMTTVPDVVLAAGDANIGNVDLASSLPAGDNNIGNVDVVSSALPTDAATATGQSGQTDLLETIDIDTGNIATTTAAGNVLTGAVAETAPVSDTASSGLNGRLQRIAQNLTTLIAKFTVGAGTEAAALRVTLPTDGTGKVGLNAGSANIGDVDVLTLPALVAGTANIGDVDVLTLPALPAGTNNIGDVDVLTLPAVTNAGTFAVQDSEKIADNAGFTDGTTKVQPIGYIFDEVAGTALTENDIGAARMNANRAAVGIIEDGATRARYATVTAANALKTDGSAVTQPVSGTVTINAIPAGSNNIGDVDVLTLPALVAGTANIGDVDVLTVPADPFGANADAVVAAGAVGSIQAKLRRATQGLEDLKTGIILAAGSAAIGKLAANSGVDIGDVDVTSLPNVTLAAGTNTNEVVGDVAEDAALAGNPVRQGVRASTAVPTAMSADNDIVTPWANRNGAQVVVTAPHVGLNSDPWNLVHETAQYTTTQTSAVLVAGGASEKIVVTKVQIQVGGTTAGTLQLYFGTGAYSRGTSRAIFDGEFAPSATSKPGVVMDGPFIAGTNGDDLMVTTSAAINPITITCWFYVVT